MTLQYIVFLVLCMDYKIVYPCTVSVVEMLVCFDNISSVLCCLAMQLQALGIGVTTKHPDSGPVPRGWDDMDISDQYWYIVIRSSDCAAWHNAQERLLQWALDDSAGNTVGCHVSGTGELHLHHNGRDVGVAWAGLPTDQPLWGFVVISHWMVEANYIIPKGEAVWCDVCQ